ncbi:MAG: recombinase family protein [Oceanospirillaceae bacterium]|nr:recombinase family protein [Oceanospirillaceae bacterium]
MHVSLQRFSSTIKMLGLATNIVNVCIFISRNHNKNCDIYTRISVDEGQGDDFDSVTAQFMACAKYIGAKLLRKEDMMHALYEDLGCSGNSLGRPGVSALLSMVWLMWWS